MKLFSKSKSEDSIVEEETEPTGCGGFVNEMGIMLGMAVIAMLMVTNKKRMGNKNEN